MGQLVLVCVVLMYTVVIKRLNVTNIEFVCLVAILSLTLASFSEKFEGFSENIQQINNRLILPKLKDLNEVLERSSKDPDTATVTITQEYVKNNLSVPESNVKEAQLAFKFIDQMLCQMSAIAPDRYKTLISSF
jgi:hypothetical protein